LIHPRAVLLCIFLFALLTAPGSILAWEGTVAGISDGDTITVLRERQEVKIRLWGIDTPERHQDFGSRAKKHTSGLAYGKTVTVRELDKDRYGRTVAMVTLPDGQVLNESLVGAGMAWVYGRYCDREVCSRWLELQAAARERRIGLWSMPNPVPPWEFRRR
jgi:endonuclease YncB( thermonuclease family)